MRAEKDRTRLGVNDIGDQPVHGYSLVFYVPSGSPMVAPSMNVVNIEDLRFDETTVRGYGPQNVELVRFPSHFDWYLLHKSVVYSVTHAEVLEAERENVSYRVQMEKDLKAVHDAATEGTYVQDLPVQQPAPPKSFQEQLDWLDQMGEKLEDEGDDERQS